MLLPSSNETDKQFFCDAQTFSLVITVKLNKSHCDEIQSVFQLQQQNTQHLNKGLFTSTCIWIKIEYILIIIASCWLFPDFFIVL